MATTALVRRPLNLVRRAVNALRATTTASSPTSSAAAPVVFYPPSPFLKWFYKKLNAVIEAAFENQSIDVSAEMSELLKSPPGALNYKAQRSTANPILINRAFYKGDHWQNGSGYIGPHPSATDAGAQQAMQEIALTFVSKNAVKEGAKRHRSGVVGRQIKWGYVPQREMKEGEKTTPAEDTAIDEATQFTRKWLNDRSAFATLQDAVITLLLSERADLRLEIPPGLAQDGGDGLTVSAATVAEAMRFIYLSHPLPDDAAIIVDDSTKSEAGLWRYDAPVKGTEDDEEPKMEGHVAICFIDQTGETVTHIYSESSPDTPVVAESRIPMNGRLLMFEMKRDALITPQVQQAQRGLNLALTMIPRTAVTAGFLERVLIDMQLPADPELDAEGQPTGKWIRKPFTVGSGTTNFFQSSEFMDEEGQIKRASGDIKWREPVSADGPIKAAATHYRDILEELGQIHMIMSGDATASGASRVMARIEYLNTLLDTKPTVEAAFRWIMDTALALAEAIAGDPGRYTSLIKCDATCRLDTGPMSPEERTALENSIGKTISRETAMLLVGVEDVDAEKSRIESDPMARTAFAKSLGDAISALTTPGGTFEGACEYIGIPTKDVALLLSGETRPEGEPNPGGNLNQEKTAKEPSGADRPLNPNPPQPNAGE